MVFASALAIARRANRPRAPRIAFFRLRKPAGDFRESDGSAVLNAVNHCLPRVRDVPVLGDRVGKSAGVVVSGLGPEFPLRHDPEHATATLGGASANVRNFNDPLVSRELTHRIQFTRLHT